MLSMKDLVFKEILAILKLKIVDFIYFYFFRFKVRY